MFKNAKLFLKNVDGDTCTMKKKVVMILKKKMHKICKAWAQLKSINIIYTSGVLL